MDTTNQTADAYIALHQQAATLETAYKVSQSASDAAHEISIKAYRRSNSLLRKMLKLSQNLEQHQIAMQSQKWYIGDLTRYMQHNAIHMTEVSDSTTIEDANAADIARDLPLMAIQQAGFDLYEMKCWEIEMLEALAKRRNECDAANKKMEAKAKVARERIAETVELEGKIKAIVAKIEEMEAGKEVQEEDA